MIKAYEARKIADSFDRAKALIEDIGKRIKTESQCGNYRAEITYHFDLNESDVDYILNELELNGYRVNFIRGITLLGELVNTFEIKWGKAVQNEIKP